ncbi:hypothetical protein [Acetobacterium sp. KB-1]|uniref:hypothetical protein n=1 Tax=Acetobacterium sp. KB-1 TaxID=2184575 RepID=UPI000DBEBC97|nr:hypothetical protein [Acetobacterium sp. KB-1]AWW26587.1 hypothetical protein DOZ58_07960 [Acetobacterium sp. KB-1]
MAENVMAAPPSLLVGGGRLIIAPTGVFPSPLPATGCPDIRAIDNRPYGGLPSPLPATDCPNIRAIDNRPYGGLFPRPYGMMFYFT